MAAAVRLEQVNINKGYELAKVVGTVASVGGATIIILFKGPPLLQHQDHITLGVISSSSKILNWTLGCVYILGNCIAWSGWMVLQVLVLKKYPARLSLIELWKVQSGGELFTILYAGLVASGISFPLQIWCIDRGGPLLTAVFQPVQTVMVAIMASMILGDQLYSGGVLGSILIVVGLYFVLRGKSKEKKGGRQEVEKDLAKHLRGQENEDNDNATLADIP